MARCQSPNINGIIKHISFYSFFCRDIPKTHLSNSLMECNLDALSQMPLHTAVKLQEGKRKSNITPPSSISQMGPRDNYPAFAVQSIHFSSIINATVAADSLAAARSGSALNTVVLMHSLRLCHTAGALSSRGPAVPQAWDSLRLIINT